MFNPRPKRQACDGCKVRKIKCSGLPPCAGCTSAGIACTFVRLPKKRGSRKLGKDTLAEIRKSQQQWQESGMRLNTSNTPNKASEGADLFEPSKVAALVLQLCVYRLRMYPVWPIIKIERLVAALQKSDPDAEVLALAYAVAAATIAQIKPINPNHDEVVKASMMEEQCQKILRRRNLESLPNLTTVRIAFFLHIYYENQKPGGVRSITYLREAITLSQIIGLHRESYYQDVESQEQQIRRRTFWLLFVTERGMSILHKMPVTLKVWAKFPNAEDSDDQNVLVGFQTLIELFWAFDRTGIFELMDQAGFEANEISRLETIQSEAFERLQRNLAAKEFQDEFFNEVQTVDITVTIHWMRIILWRISKVQRAPSVVPSQNCQKLEVPFAIARDLISGVTEASDLSIEAHGPGLEIKTYQVICFVIEAATDCESNIVDSYPEDAKVFAEILRGLCRLLKNNKELQSRVQRKLNDLQMMNIFPDADSPTNPYVHTLSLNDQQEHMNIPVHRAVHPQSYHQNSPNKSLIPGPSSLDASGDPGMSNPPQFPATSPTSTSQILSWHTPTTLHPNTESESGNLFMPSIEEYSPISSLNEQQEQAVMQYVLEPWFAKNSHESHLTVNSNSPIDWV